MSSMFKRAHLFDIPGQFYSDVSKKPFTHCLSCNTPLLTGETEYIIEKAIRKYREYNTSDTIFEYAVCLKCHEQFLSSYSEESLANIRGYFMHNSAETLKREYLYSNLEEGSFKVEEWLSNCMIKGTPASEMDEYQIGCQCKGDKIVVRDMPFLLGLEAMDEITRLLSNKTIDEMNGFIDQFLGLPPDLKKLFKDSGIVIF